MKIVIDARSLGTKPSGVGIYLYNFLIQLIQCNDIELFLITDVEESQEINNLKVLDRVFLISYGKKINKNFQVIQYFKFIQKQINKIKPEIFWEVNNIIPIKITNSYGKIVVTIHDMFPIYLSEYYGKIYPYYFRYGVYNTSNIADAVIYNSNQTKKESEKYFKKLRNKKSFVSYIIVEGNNGLNVSKKGFFLYIGNLEKRKGTDLLLRAFKIYYEKGGNYKLHLIGKIRDKEIQEIYDNMRLNNYPVEYLGYVDTIKKQQELSECNCFIFPSRAEGFGIPVIEALGYEKPVIASRLPIFEEIVGNNADFFDINMNDSNREIKNLVECMENFNQPSPIECEKIIKKYSSENLTSNLYNFFRELINNK